MTVKVRIALVEDRCGCVAVMVVIIDDSCSDGRRSVYYVERSISSLRGISSP